MKPIHISLFIQFLTSLTVTSSFRIVDIEANPAGDPTAGSTVRLRCKTSSWYEYCVWKHKDRVCEFEWKRSHWAVKEASCSAFHRKVEFIGNYETH